MWWVVSIYLASPIANRPVDIGHWRHIENDCSLLLPPIRAKTCWERLHPHYSLWHGVCDRHQPFSWSNEAATSSVMIDNPLTLSVYYMLLVSWFVSFQFTANTLDFYRWSKNISIVWTLSLSLSLSHTHTQHKDISRLLFFVSVRLLTCQLTIFSRSTKYASCAFLNGWIYYFNARCFIYLLMKCTLEPTRFQLCNPKLSWSVWLLCLRRTVIAWIVFDRATNLAKQKA